MEELTIVYRDESILVCVKPAGVLSTDEPGGLPELLRRQLGEEKGCVRTVHRLDRVVSGLMVLARTPEAASELSRQIREREFDKEYLAVIHGYPTQPEGCMRDLLRRDKAERKTYVTDTPAKGVQEAVLTYRVLSRAGDLSRVRIHLETGRTHQIRVHMASIGHPLLGDPLYGPKKMPYPVQGGQLLHAFRIGFVHPRTGEEMLFEAPPEARFLDWQRRLKLS